VKRLRNSDSEQK